MLRWHESSLCGLLVAVFVVGLQACSAPERELSSTVPPDVALPSGRVPTDSAKLLEKFSETGSALEMMERLHRRPIQVLQISGGGQYGAFGAGVLVGWGESGQRPKFDIVTGISVGGLIASYAFLGTPADDRALAELFMGLSKDQVYTERGFLALLTGNSYMDTGPLQRLIEQRVDETLLERVAAAYDEGRRLLVAATNLDRNELWVWNLTKLAKEGTPEALEMYRKVLLASASPPVAFPPVEIDGYLFGDGAVRNNLLIIGLVGPTSGAHREASPQRGNIHVIYNGRLTTTPSAIRNDTRSLLLRSLGMMMDARMESSLFFSFGLAQIHGYAFRMIRIPDEVEVGSNQLAFDPEEMRAVFEIGRSMGSSGNAWQSKPPTTQEVAPWLLDAIEERQKDKEMLP